MREQYTKQGFYMAWGALKLLGFLLIPFFIYSTFFKPVDSCDKDRWNRCGMQVVTDAGTGKQYLLSPYGGVIERATTKND